MTYSVWLYRCAYNNEAAVFRRYNDALKYLIEQADEIHVDTDPRYGSEAKGYFFALGVGVIERHEIR